MCGRTTSTLRPDEVAELLNVDEVDAPELPASWNIAPTQSVYVAATATDGRRKLRALRWGLVPHWAKDPRIGSKLVNARAETLASKPAYRDLVTRRRGLAPFSGFYEWQRSDEGTRAPKQPFYFCARSGAPLVLAVLWDVWWDAERRPMRTCSIVTTRANLTLAPVHHRMPVVLGAEHWGEWLSPGPLSPGRLEQLLVPAPDDLLDARPVGLAVNKATNDGPELVEAATLHVPDVVA